MMGVLTNSERCDRLLDALNHRYRRRLLMALAEHNPQPVQRQLEAGFTLESAASLDGDDVASLVEIIHTHLPKLESYGYVSWDEPADQISKGEQFETIEPLLTLLLSHEDELGVSWT